MKIGIVTGGHICHDFVESELEIQCFDHIIAVDHGADFFLMSKFVPELVVGDFDSIQSDTLEQLYEKHHMTIEKHPAQKDETDTELAIGKAIAMGATQIIIYGATGSRMDHVLGNIQLLKAAMDHGVDCFLQDENNRIRMINKSISIEKEKQFGYYVSLIPFTPEVKKVTLKGMKYPLEQYDLKSGIARCVSNEIVDEYGVIEMQDGIMLVIESKRD